MRILHVSDCYLPLLGGIEMQVSQLAARQHAAGHDVRVLTATPARPGARGRSREDDGGVAVHRMAAAIPGGAPVHPWPRGHARRLLASFRPDVVHLHIGGLTPTTQALMPVVRDLGIPAVVTVHSVWGPLAVGAYALAERLVRWSRWGLVLSGVSELAAGHIRRAAPGAQVHVLRNGVDPADWLRDPLPRPAVVHAVSAGRFAPRKRMLPLLATLRRARALLPPDAELEVTLAGAGPQLARAQAYVARHGMDWVHLPGRRTRTELVELYRRADVYLSPGVREAFGIAVFEARAAGLAVVSRSQAGAAELLVDGTDALLADDDEAMARAIARLVTDRGLREAMVAHNRAVPPATAWPAVLAEAEALYRRAGA
ncbi:glycosyltransferase family 4 protein [Georgenia faecalis]|uniref:Glycosyltransferase family 4 protein n=1 Tax=Georgenia faecalis TaxID=2483799 RepID=A0ABV9D7J7_9MICO|nr:glycosyltransferase family 4 protein [Georgenia faecalis]